MKYPVTRVLPLFLAVLFSVPMAHSEEGGWETLTVEARKLTREGHYGRAEIIARKAIEVAEKTMGPDHPDVARSLNNLAFLYRVQGKNTQAGELYTQAWLILEVSLGPDHPDVGTTINAVASLMTDEGDYIVAESLFRRSLGILEKSLGPNHPEVAKVLENMAILYRNAGNTTRQKELDERARKIRSAR